MKEKWNRQGLPRSVQSNVKINRHCVFLGSHLSLSARFDAINALSLEMPSRKAIVGSEHRSNSSIITIQRDSGANTSIKISLWIYFLSHKIGGATLQYLYPKKKLLKILIFYYWAIFLADSPGNNIIKKKYTLISLLV